MEQIACNVCRLCLTYCHEFEPIEESHQEMFNAILLTPNLAISDEPVVCKACIENLQNCVSYKTVSLDLEKYYLTIINGCMFCHKCTGLEKFVLLNSDQLDVMLLKAMMEQFFPQLDLKMILNPMVCVQCYKSLQKNFDFIVRCLNVEQQIKNYCESVCTNNKGHVDLIHVINTKIESKGSDETNTPCIKTEESYVEMIKANNDTDVLYFPIKEEDDENVKDTIKVEKTIKADFKVDIDEIILNNATEFSFKYKDDECNENNLCEEVKIEDYVVDKVIDVSKDVAQINRGPERGIEDNLCDKVKIEDYGDIDKVIGVSKDVQINRGPEKAIEDNLCDEMKIEAYDFGKVIDIIKNVTQITRGPDIDIQPKDETHKRKYDSSKDSQVREDITDKADEWWSYLAVNNRNKPQNQELFSKSELRKMIATTNVSGQKRYQCQVCQFIAKAKCSMNRHMMLHQLPSELPIFKCNDCDYKAKRKSDIAQHVLCHIENYRKPKFKCKYCTHEAATKSNLRTHMLRHRNLENFKNFECYLCGFKTWSKDRITRHVHRHRDMTYQCDRCSYQTKSRGSLARHKRKHRRGCEGKKFKCEYCDFRSKSKGAVMGTHRKFHRNPVSCAYCHYESLYLAEIREHTRKCHSDQFT